MLADVSRRHDRKAVTYSKPGCCVGRGGVIRTHDPLLPKQMRYQAALRPVNSTLLFYRSRVP